MKLGTTWQIQLNTHVQMEGYLSGPTANEVWSDQWSKDQNKGKTPLGCGFKGTQSFGTWWTNLAGWEKLIIKALATIAVSMATLGAYDAVVGAEVAADATEAVVDGVEVATDAGSAAGAEAAAEAAADAAVGEAVDAAAAEVEGLAVADGEIVDFADEDARTEVTEEEKKALKTPHGLAGALGLDGWSKTIFNVTVNHITSYIVNKAAAASGHTQYDIPTKSGWTNFFGLAPRGVVVTGLVGT